MAAAAGVVVATSTKTETAAILRLVSRTIPRGGYETWTRGAAIEYARRAAEYAARYPEGNMNTQRRQLALACAGLSDLITEIEEVRERLLAIQLSD